MMFGLCLLIIHVSLMFHLSMTHDVWFCLSDECLQRLYVVFVDAPICWSGCLNITIAC